MTTQKEIQTNIKKWVKIYIGSDFQFRPNQLEVIVNIVSNIVNHQKQIIAVEAPTGTGKSLINIISAGVLAEYYKKTSYILCSDLFLWSQYDKFIKKHYKLSNSFGSIKGQMNNYKCLLTQDDISLSPCRIKRISWGKLFNHKLATSMGFSCASDCPYIKDRRKAVNSKVTLMTYQLYFKMIQWTKEKVSPSTFINRDVVFCDECHNISNIVSSQYDLNFKQTDFDILKKVWNIVYDASMIEQQVKLYDIAPKNKDEKLKQDFFNEVVKSKKAFDKNLKEWKAKMFDSNLSNKENYDLLIEIQAILTAVVTPFVEKKLEELKKEMSSNTQLSYADRTTLSLFNAYDDLFTSLNNIVETYKQCGEETYLIKKLNYVFDSNDFKKQIVYSVTFLCAREDWMVYNYLLSKSEYKVFVSATVGTKEMLKESLGIGFYDRDEISKRTSNGTMFYDAQSDKDPQDFDYTRLDSDFDFDKSPIYFIPGHKMSFSDKEHSLMVLRPLIYKICESFGNQKGIIQTGSYQLMTELIKNAPDDIKNRLLAYDNARIKDEYIKRHASNSTTNTILIGPTLCEGIDLPQDLCRFIIILKVPYPNLKDELTQAKIKLFPSWYNSTTSNLIIQGIGRGNRSKDDYCATFILDGCFGQLYAQTSEQYPEFIKRRIKIAQI